MVSRKGPALQNIPIRTEEGRKIRKAFIPDQSYLLVSADYSSIELKIVQELGLTLDDLKRTL